MSYRQPSVTQGAAEQARLLAGHARYLIATAARAPSIHNSQPWRFRVDADAVELWADPARKTRDDAIGREMLISCGAALFGLRLAVRSLGYLPVVDLLPDPAQLRLLARVRVATGAAGHRAQRAGAADARGRAAPAHPSRPLPGGAAAARAARRAAERRADRRGDAGAGRRRPARRPAGQAGRRGPPRGPGSRRARRDTAVDEKPAAPGGGRRSRGRPGHRAVRGRAWAAAAA